MRDPEVICHCDDFGLTATMTHRIADAWEAGLIDGFSVIANGTALPEVAARLHDAAGRKARVAVHLNLFEGPALSPRAEVPALTDDAGNLDSSFAGLWLRWLLRRSGSRGALLRQVGAEWRRQIITVRDLVSPRRIDALDGHLHVHMLPFLFPLVVALAREFGIGQVRLVNEVFYLSPRLADSVSGAFLLNLVKNRVLALCVPGAQACLRHGDVQATDAFVGVLYTGRMSRAAAAAGVEAAKRRGAGSVELLFHIGRASEREAEAWRKRGGSTPFLLSELRDREYDALRALRD